MESDPALEWLLQAQRQAHAAAKRLDEAVEEHRRLTRKRTDDVFEWAFRAGNPKFDKEWQT